MPERNFSRAHDDANARKFGEAPILGKVPRSPGSAVRGTNGKKIRSKRRKKLSRYVLAWTCLLSFVTACVIVVVIVTYFRAKAALPEGEEIGSGMTTDLELAFPDQNTPALPGIKGQDALRITKSALANRDPALVADHFALGEVSDPEEALHLLELIRKHEGEVTAMQWLGEKFYNGGQLGEVVVSMDNGVRPGNRLAQFIAGADGKWRIDLDSYLRKASPDWEKILSGKSATSLVRVFVSTDSHYNGIYADESAWKAYALASPDVANVLYGYAKRGSSQDKALARILSSEEPFHRATLRIAKNPDSQAKQFEISRVVSENWVIGESDFDGAF